MDEGAMTEEFSRAVSGDLAAQRQAERVRGIRRRLKRQRLGCHVPVPDDLEEGARQRIPPKAAGRMRQRGVIPAPAWVIRALKPRVGWARARRATEIYWANTITFHDGRITRTISVRDVEAWARGELIVGPGRPGEQLLTVRVPEPTDAGVRRDHEVIRRQLATQGIHVPAVLRTGFREGATSHAETRALQEALNALGREGAVVLPRDAQVELLVAEQKGGV